MKSNGINRDIASIIFQMIRPIFIAQKRERTRLLQQVINPTLIRNSL